MPQDANPTVDTERLRRIQEDIKYFRAAHAAAGPGVQPPTVYAAKYVEDMEFMLALVDMVALAATPEPAKPKASTPKGTPR